MTHGSADRQKLRLDALADLWPTGLSQRTPHPFRNRHSIAVRGLLKIPKDHLFQQNLEPPTHHANTLPLLPSSELVGKITHYDLRSGAEDGWL